jgi:hypothetical protein
VVLRAGLYDLEQNKNVIPVPGVEPWIVQHLALSLYRRPACALKMSVYRGADKSLARPGRKKATATKPELLQATENKKPRRFSFQPDLRGSNDLRVGRKMATFYLFFQSGRSKDLSAPL